MAIQKILKMGDPRLFEISSLISEIEFPEVREIVEDMIDTMNDADGAGLAAPQIGIMKRIVIFGVDDNPRYPTAENVPFNVVINPEIDLLDGQLELGWEGCLSVPGMRGLVARNSHIRYSGLDLNGNKFDRTVSGFHARVVQHECDHLDGILYPMRIADMRNFGFEEELFELPLDCPPVEAVDSE